MLEKGNTLKLEDNNEYIVLDLFNENGIIYIYLVDINNNSNIVFGKLENDEIIELNNPNELEKVIELFNKHLHEKND